MYLSTCRHPLFSMSVLLQKVDMGGGGLWVQSLRSVFSFCSSALCKKAMLSELNCCGFYDALKQHRMGLLLCFPLVVVIILGPSRLSAYKTQTIASCWLLFLHLPDSEKMASQSRALSFIEKLGSAHSTQMAAHGHPRLQFQRIWCHLLTSADTGLHMRYIKQN